MANDALRSAMRVFDAINTGDLSCLPDCVTSEFVDHGSPFPLPPGPGGYAQILGFVHHGLKIRYSLEETITTEDRIVLRARAHGVGLAEFHGPEAAGRPYDMQTIHIYRTEGDRLAEHWGVRDELGAMVRMGVLPAPQPPVPA
ncbi:MAG TPA: ester cyclase [Propionicimonas sp.]|jgi:ketosteroid isomerase-like protein